MTPVVSLLKSRPSLAELAAACKVEHNDLEVEVEEEVNEKDEEDEGEKREKRRMRKRRRIKKRRIGEGRGKER